MIVPVSQGSSTLRLMPRPPHSIAPPQGPRRGDARRNRERILAAATAAFSELGVDTAMTDIADRAGLGIGTVYRNFPTKEALVDALLLDRLVRVSEEATAVRAASTDPWSALERFIRFVVDLEITDRAVAQFIGGRISGSPELQQQRDALFEAVGEIVRDAQHAGQLRTDVHPSDIRMLLTTVARSHWHDSPETRHLLQRYLAIALDGLRAPGRTPLTGPPLSMDQLEQAVCDSRGHQPAFTPGQRRW